MRLLLIIISLAYSFLAVAQRRPAYDSSHVDIRNFSSSTADPYKKDIDFQYERQIVDTPSLWERFWQWFWNKYDDMVSTEAGRITMKVFYWVLGIGAVAFFVFKVTGMNRISLFASQSQQNPAYTIEDENIHDISFDTAIQQALQEGNYRLAIRLLYLQSLKILSDKNLIIWQLNKTNTDYFREISRAELKQQFKNVTHAFEYTWYGNLAIGKDEFTEMKEEFMNFQKQL
jgi:hypothetical protein